VFYIFAVGVAIGHPTFLISPTPLFQHHLDKHKLNPTFEKFMFVFIWKLF